MFIHYSATGNTFLAFDNRELGHQLNNKEYWSKVAEDVGVDGLLFLERSDNCDFKMRYLNRDGGEVSMCGNGARAILSFAYNELNIKPKNKLFTFETMNGVYEGDAQGTPFVLMSEFKDLGSFDVSEMFDSKQSLYLDTGVPHCVFLCENVHDLDLEKISSPIRNHDLFKEGCNVNFVSRNDKKQYEMRTYERGVERETLSCGTGAMAVAILLSKLMGEVSPLTILTPGGDLTLSWNDDYIPMKLQGDVLIIKRGDSSQFSR